MPSLQGTFVVLIESAKTHVHFPNNSLVLMTYYGVVLLLTGYQADEQHTQTNHNINDTRTFRLSTQITCT